MREYKETRHSLIYKNSSDLSFYSAGIDECKPSYKYGPRIRPYHLIHFVLKGKGTLKIQDYEFQLEKGDIFIIPADIASFYQADGSDPWTYAWVSFLGLYSQTYLDQIRSSLPEPFIIRQRELEPYRQLIQELVKLKDNSTSNYFLANSILLRIISQLFEDVSFNEESWDDYSLADQVKFYLEMNYSKPLRIKEVAEEFSIHPNYLTRIFKERFSKTPKQFLMELKYQKAQGLLATTDLTVSVIAHAIGCEDPLSFTKTFKNLYGVSPTEYRKQCRTNTE